VVSLVPSVTEVLFRIGAGDTVTGVTYHSTYPPETVKKEIVGGFFSPSLDRIEAMNPDVIFISGLHKKVIARFGNGRCQLITLKTDSIADSFQDIRLLGKIFNRKKEASRIIADIKRELQIVSKKVAKIPTSKRKRVIRLMGRNQIMTPGNDSFQNEMIRAAGGIPPDLNKKGNIVPVTQKEWQAFNPQVIYGCGGDSETAKLFFDRSGWKDVEAIKNSRIFYLPCDLTCRAATNSGYFVSWLSASIYPEEFSKRSDQVLKEMIFKTRKLDIDLDYIKNVRIAYSHIYDFINKTLIVDFKTPLSIVSTIEGQRTGIITVGNHYSSPMCWGIGHNAGLEGVRSRVYQVIGHSMENACFLFTGADMDNLSIKKEKFKDMIVYALVTAGVRSNALRMSRDEGKYYEPGTINIILLSNMQLTPRAMTRAIISATEGKTAALLDMDVRSTYSSRIYRATGTGTDNIIVVQGTGTSLENAGGHSKLGELIARAVYAGVQDAVYMQNGLVLQRNVFQRIKERQISLRGLISDEVCDCVGTPSEFAAAVEEILLDPRYAAFLEASLVLSDDYEKGLLKDLSVYEHWCQNVAVDIAGKKIATMSEFVVRDDLPVVLKMALNAILNGTYHKIK
jgi:ABC-type Fe3+-hydroxamate transport system substrate-binding protein/adenosylcobinamide amidohydrolase